MPKERWHTMVLATRKLLRLSWPHFRSPFAAYERIGDLRSPGCRSYSTDSTWVGYCLDPTDGSTIHHCHHQYFHGQRRWLYHPTFLQLTSSYCHHLLHPGMFSLVTRLLLLLLPSTRSLEGVLCLHNIPVTATRLRKRLSVGEAWKRV